MEGSEGAGLGSRQRSRGLRPGAGSGGRGSIVTHTDFITIGQSLSQLSLEGTRGRVKDQLSGEVGPSRLGSSLFSIVPFLLTSIVKGDGRLAQSEAVQSRVEIKSGGTGSRPRSGRLWSGPGHCRSFSRSGPASRLDRCSFLIIHNVQKILQSSSRSWLSLASVPQSRVPHPSGFLLRPLLESREVALLLRLLLFKSRPGFIGRDTLSGPSRVRDFVIIQLDSR